MNAQFDCEPLESRTLLSGGWVAPFISIEPDRKAPQLAPASIVGLSFTRVITKGKRPLASSGTYKVVYSKKTDKVETSEGDWGGTYTYAVTGKDTATIETDDSVDGELTVTLTFTSATTGVFHIARAAGGNQNGTFTI